MKVVVNTLCLFYVLITSIQCIPELQLLHVVFAHKTYAPVLDIINSNDSFPANLTYEYFNTAAFNMPNNGRLNMYNLGVHLRETYDQFLGDVYTSEVMKMQTTEYPISMMSGQLVNSGLWPPSESQKWDSDMEWQPIPIEYVTAQRDTLLLGMQCPIFNSEVKRLLRTREVQQKLLYHSPLFDHLSNSIEMEIREPSKVALLYSVLETEADLNQSLPLWTEDIFPHGEMYNVTLLEYDLLSQTHLQKQLLGGVFIKEILANSLKYIHGSIPKERKLMMYSGNDRSIVGILKSLDLWSPHIPNEAASLIFEMYIDNETETHGIKINYYTGVEGDTIPLTVHNCTEICPLKRFLNLFFDVLPQNEHVLCNFGDDNLVGSDIFLESTEYNRSGSHKQKFLIIPILFIISLFVR